MLLILTEVKESKIHGLGVFSSSLVKLGTPVLRYVPGVDSDWTEEQILAMPEFAQRYLYNYLWKLPRSARYILDVDHGRYINHSGSPNLAAFSDAAVAKRDIQVGEELTIDYREFCYTVDPLFDKLNKILHLEEDPFMEKILEVAQ